MGDTLWGGPPLYAAAFMVLGGSLILRNAADGTNTPRDTKGTDIVTYRLNWPRVDSLIFFLRLTYSYLRGMIGQCSNNFIALTAFPKDSQKLTYGIQKVIYFKMQKCAQYSLDLNMFTDSESVKKN